MKKLVSVVLVAVFAMSFFAGITALRTEAKPKPICEFYSCDYQKERVLMLCYKNTPGRVITYYQWNFDPAVFQSFCY